MLIFEHGSWRRVVVVEILGRGLALVVVMVGMMMEKMMITSMILMMERKKTVDFSGGELLYRR
jgi:hypothetical protein